MKREYDFSRGKRASFKGLPPRDQLASHTKVRITIMLDYDVLQFFKAGASKPGAAPYQTQINKALREYIAGRGSPDQKALLSDEDFIARLSERVARYSVRKKARIRPGSRGAKG